MMARQRTPARGMRGAWDWRRLVLAPYALMVLGLSACASAGPPALGALFVDPDGTGSPRVGRLIEHPQWVRGPDDIDFELMSRVRLINQQRGGNADPSAEITWPTEPVTLECQVTPEGLLSLCAPYQGPLEWSPLLVRPYIAAMQLATAMELSPLDGDGQPVAGGRVRVTVRWPETPPPPSNDVVTIARILNLPGPYEFARMYPQRALETGTEGDVILLCVVAASGLTEGCEVFFESASEVGLGAASQELYRNIRILPPRVNGLPQRALVAATVRWRLQ